MSVSPNPGDRVKITITGTVTDLDDHGTVAMLKGDREQRAHYVPRPFTVEVLETAVDPGKDPIGTVRQSPNGVVVVKPFGAIGWKVVWDCGATDRDYYGDHDVAGWALCQPVAFTPAAEANPVPPQVLQRMREMLNNGQKIRAIKAAREACVGLGLKEAKAFVESMPEHATCVAVLDGQLRDGIVAASREPRVFQSDGPEPPEDVRVVRDVDCGKFMPYLHKVPGGWRWGHKPDVPTSADEAETKSWHVAARSTYGNRLVEVLS